MPKSTKPPIGSITWMDLPVKDAGKVRDFYKAAAGWKSAGLDMGGYSDFCISQPADGKTVAGICRALGESTNFLPQWLIYINVANLKQGLVACRRRGGKVLWPIREMGGGRMAVIRDPAGAAAALFESGET